jgi:uncharacterized protein DUF6265
MSMKMRFAQIAVALSVIGRAAGVVASQEPTTAPAKPATLAQLAWIAGDWVDDAGGDLSQEIWAPPNGDSMMGMWRYVAKGKVQIFELLSITEEKGGPVFRLRHFDPRMVAREEKDKPLVLALVALKVREAAFEGPGQPKGTVRLTYRQPGPDALSVTLDKDGRSEVFQFRRKKQ